MSQDTVPPPARCVCNVDGLQYLVFAILNRVNRQNIPPAADEGDVIESGQLLQVDESAVELVLQRDMPRRIQCTLFKGHSAKPSSQPSAIELEVRGTTGRSTHATNDPFIHQRGRGTKPEITSVVKFEHMQTYMSL